MFNFKIEFNHRFYRSDVGAGQPFTKIELKAFVPLLQMNMDYDVMVKIFFKKFETTGSSTANSSTCILQKAAHSNVTFHFNLFFRFCIFI